MNATGQCTCECPDGPDQHLENCEAYLRYWEERKVLSLDHDDDLDDPNEVFTDSDIAEFGIEDE